MITDCFLQEKAGQSKPADMLPFLENAPDVAPSKDDERLSD